MNFEVKSNYELKDADSKTGMVTGYCSIFNNIDSDKDMVMMGAFSKSIIERGPGSSKPRIKHLWQHSSWEPIGIPVKMEEHEKGLYFETQFGKDSFSQDKLQQHIDGIITELSIGFQTIKADNVNDEKENLMYRKLTELKLWEYSSVTWGANSLTEVVSAKGENSDILAELNRRIETLTKALRHGKYTDDTCEQFEAELNKIQSMIKSLPLKEPELTTLEIVKPTIEINTISETIKNAFKI